MRKKYFLYLLRWQCSTPILAIILIALADQPILIATIIANLIGGSIFFWVDRKIFTGKFFSPERAVPSPE